MKICPVEAELFDADGWTEGTDRQTEIMKLIAVFRNFAKLPENGNELWYMRDSSFPQFSFQDSGLSRCNIRYRAV